MNQSELDASSNAERQDMAPNLIKGELRDTLSGLTGETELVDENGQLLGYFTPPDHEDEWADAGVTETELLRRVVEEPDGQTWAEIRRELEQRA